MIPQHGTLEISRSRFLHNVARLQKSAGAAHLCATIKANAYGHGIDCLGPLLEAANVPWVSTYTLHEARAIAATHGHCFNILVLAPFVSPPDMSFKDSPLAQHLQDHHWNLRINLTDLDSARALSRLATTWGERYTIKVHLQIDTGLTRLGIHPDAAATLCEQIAALPGLALEGLFSHLSHGDVPHHPTLDQQRESFQKIAAPLKQKFPHLLLHLQNSGGTFNLSTENLDMVRIGIALYGLQPSTTHPIVSPHTLQPIAQLTAPILAIHDRPAHIGVGYGHTFITTRQSRLAIVPVGYADGYPRQLSNTKNAIAQLRGIDVPVVGRVSMDQIILDITGIPTASTGLVQPGETVTVICNNPAKPNSLDAMATAINTIGYELATHLGTRLKRIIVD